MVRAKFCYVVLCHTDAEVVFRLTQRIRALSPTAAILLRHDRDDFITEEQAKVAGAELLRSRIPIIWGAWNMTAAVLEAFEHAASSSDADYFVLISGQDYPIRDLQEWESTVDDDKIDALIGEFDEPLNPDLYDFIWATPFLAPRWVPEVADRAAGHLWFRVGGALKWVGRVNRSARDKRWAVGVRRPSLLWGGQPPLPLVKGAQWITLSRRGLHAGLEAHRMNRRARRFFRTTRLADEMYLPSLLCSDASLKIVRGPTSYARFPARSSSPVWIDADELRRAMNTSAPFVRKVPGDAEDVRARADARTRHSGRSVG
jgi:hypothetical protein